jgi:glycosyltransferase involved in cell wall biosynthesis
MNNPDISIVVCTQNRSALLRGALQSLCNLETEALFDYEIVVVDNASTDATPRVIAEIAAESPDPIRGVREPERGIVPARNRGIRESRGQWIAFFDDDQIADPQWLLELYNGAQERSSRVVGGSVHLALPDNCKRRLSAPVRMLLGEAKLGDRPLRYGGRLTPGCGNLMIERSVFEQIGMFERTVSGRGEDTDLFSRIERAGIAAWYLPDAIVHHLTPAERLETRYLLDLARRMGEGVALRQAAQGSQPRFFALWLAKLVRLGLVQAPITGLSWLLGARETAIGHGCLARINASYVQAGWNQFWRRQPTRRITPTPRAAYPALSAK